MESTMKTRSTELLNIDYPIFSRRNGLGCQDDGELGWVQYQKLSGLKGIINWWEYT